MKYTEFIRIAIARKFSCTLPEQITDELQILAAEQSTEALRFIVLGFDYSLNPNQEKLNLLQNLIEEPIPRYESYSFENGMSFVEKDSLISAAFSFLLTYPSCDETLILLSLASFEEKTKLQSEIFEEIWKIYPLMFGELTIENFCDSFNLLYDLPPRTEKTLKAMSFMIEKIIEIQKDKKDALLALYWYYSYLGEIEIIDLLSAHLPFASFEEKEESIDDFSWPWFSNELILNRYQKIISIIKKQSPDRKIKLDKLRTRMDEASLLSLIPTLLYARSVGDTYIESWVLRFVWKKKNSPRVINRISELCGYSVPEELSLMVDKQRGQWIVQSLHDCMKIKVDMSFIDPELIFSVKKAYTLQPFSIVVIDALISCSIVCPDDDIRKMLAHSINNTTSVVDLSNSLQKSIRPGGDYAVQVILGRMVLLGMYKNILHTISTIPVKNIEKKIKTLRLVFLCIDFYGEFTPSDQKDHERFTQVSERFLFASYNKSTNVSKKSSLKKNKETLNLFYKENYDALFALINSDDISCHNTVTLEIILKAAIKIRNPYQIRRAYDLLVKLDSSRASFYNVDVEPFLSLRRKSSKNLTQASDSLVSRIWGIPANFSQPVNVAARNVSNKF